MASRSMTVFHQSDVAQERRIREVSSPQGSVNGRASLNRQIYDLHD